MITAEASLGGNLRRWLLAGVAVAWVAGWMWFARYHFLDDALIHLRYADLSVGTRQADFRRCRE